MALGWCFRCSSPLLIGFEACQVCSEQDLFNGLPHLDIFEVETFCGRARGQPGSIALGVYPFWHANDWFLESFRTRMACKAGRKITFPCL